MATTTEVTLVSGDRFQVEGSVDEVAAKVSEAARGSILALASFTETDGRSLLVNPQHVAAIRASGERA